MIIKPIRSSLYKHIFPPASSLAWLWLNYPITTEKRIYFKSAFRKIKTKRNKNENQYFFISFAYKDTYTSYYICTFIYIYLKFTYTVYEMRWEKKKSFSIEKEDCVLQSCFEIKISFIFIQQWKWNVLWLFGIYDENLKYENDNAKKFTVKNDKTEDVELNCKKERKKKYKCLHFIHLYTLQYIKKHTFYSMWTQLKLLQ